jgi:hypothetical protein
MKNRNNRASEIFLKWAMILMIVMTFFMISCAGEPVSVDMPVNHPANPQSNETAFIPPPNPFQNNIPTAEHQGDNSSSMNHENHQPAQRQQSNPKMDNMSHDPASSLAPEAQDPELQHKEHH